MSASHGSLAGQSPEQLRRIVAVCHDQERRGATGVEFWSELRRDCEAMLAEQGFELPAEGDPSSHAHVAQVFEDLLDGCIVRGTPLDVFGHGTTGARV